MLIAHVQIGFVHVHYGQDIFNWPRQFEPGHSISYKIARAPSGDSDQWVAKDSKRLQWDNEDG